MIGSDVLPFSMIAAAILALAPVGSQGNAAADRSMEEAIGLLREEKVECVHDAASQVLIYIGGTEDEAVACFEQHRHADVRTLRVSSFGGSVGPAITGARIIQAEKWAVEAFGVCASSCMNYWAPAAASFSSTPGTVLVVHGRPPRRLKITEQDLRDSGMTAEEAKLFMANKPTMVYTAYAEHKEFARGLKIPDDWFGSTLAAGGKIAKGIGDPKAEGLLVGPCHARLIAATVPMKVWWPSTKRELREFVAEIPIDVRLKQCELDGLPE